MSIYAGDWYVSGGRTGWGEKLIHFGTRRGNLGIYAGVPILLILLNVGFWAPSFSLFTASLLTLIWIFLSFELREDKPVWADHVMMAVESGDLGRVKFVEMCQSGGWRYSYPEGNAPKWKIYRVPDLSAAQMVKLVVQAHISVASNRPYRWKLNVAFGLDYITGLGLWDCRWWRTHLVAKAARVCSSGVWGLYRDSKIPGFSLDPRYISPDDIAYLGDRTWMTTANGGTGHV